LERPLQKLALYRSSEPMVPSRSGVADRSTVVIVHTESGDAYAGLPNGPQADHEFDWSSVATI
jgi:hypothetical protein